MMKKIIFTIVAALIFFTKSTAVAPLCTYRTVLQDFAPVSFAEITIDGNLQHPLITRFFHNKIGISGQETAECYFNVLEPEFIIRTVGVVGAFFFLNFIYLSITKKQWLLLAAFIVAPAIPILGYSPEILTALYKIFAIIGLALFLRLP